MRMFNRLALALRLLRRDWRAGELRLFVAALVVAVGAVTAVGFFNDRIERGLTQRSAEMLGADFAVSGSVPIAKEWLDAAGVQELRASTSIDFASVIVRGDRLQLAGIRAVDGNYPVRGEVRTAPALYQPDAPSGTPALGTIWVESRLLHALGVAIGDRVDVGSAKFIVARVLTYEPGRAGNFFAFAPRAMIHVNDIERTGVIQPGSRITYTAGFAGAAAAVTAYRNWIGPQLTANQRLLEPREGNTAIGRAMERVERYIGLTSLLAVLLAGVAIAMAARRYSVRHYDMSALLRCLGITQSQIVALYLPQFLVLGVVASAIGCVVGFAAQAAIYWCVRDLFPIQLPAPGFAPVLYGLGTGLATLAGFAIVPVLRLKRVPPLRVLRRDLTPLPPSAWLVYGIAGATVLALAKSYTGSWTLTLGVLAGGIAAAAALAAIAWGLLRMSQRWRRRRGLVWRFGLSHLSRRTPTSIGQMLAFGLTLMAMSLIALVRTDLLATWQAQLPPDTPNHFAFNVLPVDVPALERFFEKNAISAQALYPMVRGRLVTINGVAVTEAVTKEQSNNEALQRELNLTWSATVPPDNRIVHGTWWTVAEANKRVSVEQKLAERLGIKLGDKLGFVVGGAEVGATVASIRSVQWDSFHPNFYMIFEPGALDEFPATYITSFRLADEQKKLLAMLVKKFPTVTVLELDQFLQQARTIVRQAALAVELVLLFVLAAGFVVLYAALAASLDERLHEGALLRSLGASRRQLRVGHLAEFVALGAFAGVLAAIGTEISAYLLYARAFGLEYSPKWQVWLLAPLCGAFLIGLAGYWGTRGVVARSPLTMLRDV